MIKHFIYGASCVVLLASCSSGPKELLPMDWDQGFASLNASVSRGGSPSEWNRLGWCYASGLGVPQNKAQAFQCFQRAAQGGNREAMLTVIGYLEAGDVVPRNIPQAMEWRKRVAVSGRREDVQHESRRLAEYYEGGGYYSEAFQWYLRGAKAGDYECCGKAGMFYQSGIGVKRDYGQAMYWYQQMLNNSTHDKIEYEAATPCMHIGMLYEYGCGVPRDYNQAMAWYDRANEYSSHAKDPDEYSKPVRKLITNLKEKMKQEGVQLSTTQP